MCVSKWSTTGLSGGAHWIPAPKNNTNRSYDAKCMCVHVRIVRACACMCVHVRACGIEHRISQYYTCAASCFNNWSQLGKPALMDTPAPKNRTNWSCDAKRASLREVTRSDGSKPSHELASQLKDIISSDAHTINLDSKIIVLHNKYDLLLPFSSSFLHVCVVMH